MSKPKVTVGILLFKDTRYLTHSLASVLNQDYGEVEYIFRDQSPNGEVYDYLKKAHPEFFEKAKIVKGPNIMHSGGHNAIMREMMGEYYFCASNDMLYPPNFVSKIVEEMARNGSKVATCKLMQWDYEKVFSGDVESSKTTRVDSFGIGITKSHYFYDIGQGREEAEVEVPKKILGPSGALAVFHKDALEAVAFKNKSGVVEYFDELLHYKNDVDLSYRLSWSGFPCLIVEGVKVYHDRQLGEKGKDAISRLKEHHEKAAWAKASSLKGHLITVRKNFDPDFSVSVKLATFLSNTARFLYTLFLAPKMLSVYKEVRELKGEILEKRKAIHKKVSAREMEALMS